MLSHGQELIVRFALFLHLVAIGEGLLTVELILFDQIGPSFLAPLVPSLVLSDFLPQIHKFCALLLKHLFAIGVIGIGSKVCLALDLSLHQHLLKAGDLGFLLDNLGRQVIGQHFMQLLFLLFASIL